MQKHVCDSLVLAGLTFLPAQAIYTKCLSYGFLFFNFGYDHMTYLNKNFFTMLFLFQFLQDISFHSKKLMGTFHNKCTWKWENTFITLKFSGITQKSPFLFLKSVAIWVYSEISPFTNLAFSTYYSVLSMAVFSSVHIFFPPFSSGPHTWVQCEFSLKSFIHLKLLIIMSTILKRG